MLENLTLTNFRNFKHAKFEFTGGLNLVCGPNGVGKTSMLEAIFLLTQGKSFRSRDLDSLIHHHDQQLVVFAQVSRGPTLINLGYHRSVRSHPVRQINGQHGVKLSEMVQCLPLQFIDTNSHRLLAESASYRRSLLNWGVFHFVPGFGQLWQRHKKIVQQRNACLKHGGEQLKFWTAHLASTATEIYALQLDYLEILRPQLQQNWERLCRSDFPLEVELYPGWNREHSLAEVLETSVASDLRTGHTQHGSHRADLRLKVARSVAGGDDEGGGKSSYLPAAKYLSQGQLKILLFALKCAQVEVLQKMGGRNCVIAIDDLTAELDGGHQHDLLQYLTTVSPQILLTSASQVTVDNLVAQLPVSLIDIAEVAVAEAVE